MPRELYINDLIGKLPPKIDAIIFSQELELFIENIASVAKLDDDQEIWLHSVITDLLIGKINISSFQKSLLDITISEQTSQLIFNYLNQKVFSNIQDELQTVQKIYEKESKVDLASEKKEASISKQTETSTTMLNYIQELAASIKKSEEPVLVSSAPIIPEEKKAIINETRPEEVKVKPIIVENETLVKKPVEVVVPEIKPVEEVPVFTPKETMVFKMMKQKEEQSNGKLNEYFKALKDNLNFESSHDSENVFQPPFKATKGRSMMVESSITDDMPKSDNTTNEKVEAKKEPIKYNSFDYMKKPNTVNEAKPADDKFIDLGDF